MVHGSPAPWLSIRSVMCTTLNVALYLYSWIASKKKISCSQHSVFGGWQVSFSSLRYWFLIAIIQYSLQNTITILWYHLYQIQGWEGRTFLNLNYLSWMFVILILKYNPVEVNHFLFTRAKSNASDIQRAPERSSRICLIIQFQNWKPDLGNRIISDKV